MFFSHIFSQKYIIMWFCFFNITNIYHGSYNKQLIWPNKAHGKMENILLYLCM